MGRTAEEVKALNKAGVVRKSEAQARREQAQREHWDKIVKGMKDSKAWLDAEVRRVWEEATKPRRRRLP